MTVDGMQSSGVQYAKMVQKSSESTALEAKSVENQQSPAETKKPSQNDGMKSLGVGGSLDLQG